MAKFVRKVKKGLGQKKISNKCYFSQTNTKPNYKDVLILRRFITDRGKILHKNFTGLTASNQRKLTNEIKKARFMALLPYTDQHAL
ncbi:MAG: 30S ribosomal protein S18 [Patescibacteria group bacterium]|jgi:small subunit ribosomal protein S18